MAKSADQITRELVEFTELVNSEFRVYALVLFGSYARGLATEFSDIDVAVFSEDFGVDLLAEMKRLFKLRRRIDTDIEPLAFRKDDFLDPSHSDFISEVVSNGKLIYREGTFYV
jgi:predicted nucleotidyltransferase